MPELPEVETVKSYLVKKIVHRKITNIKVLNSKLRWPINTRSVRRVIGYEIREVRRRGKYILLDFEGTQLSMVIHLGMTGIISLSKIGEYKKEKHDHLLIIFEDLILIYNDVRKFGSIHLTEETKNMFLLKNLGPEPMSGEFDSNYLFNASIDRKCSIKELLMNQKIVVGIGNIYVTESLFISKIHPSTPASRITKSQCKILIKNIKTVLSKAISMGGSTIKDFLNAEGKPGYFSQKLLVYQKTYCPIHKKNLIKNIRISGRSSFFCDICQKNN